MREITKEMIDEFRIRELGNDFMGYQKQGSDLLTFHHLIVPRRLCTDELNGYTRNNGAILYTTPHQYLHLIEAYDRDIFEIITSEMIDENIKGYIDKQNIRYIDDALKYFEREYSGHTTNKGKPLIKEEYTTRHI